MRRKPPKPMRSVTMERKMFEASAGSSFSFFSTMGMALPKVVDIRLEIRAPSTLPALDGSGMMIVNAPYTLEAELAVLMPVLTRLLSPGPGGRWSVETIGTERA